MKDMNWAMVMQSFLNREGKKFAREGWNGKGLFTQAQYPDENSKMTVPYMYISVPTGQTNVDGIIYTRSPWKASNTDEWASDWFEVV